MGGMKNRLAQIEARLQAVIEGAAARFFPLRPAQNDLAYRLIEAMRAGMQPQEEGAPLAPNLYTVVVHPQRAQALQAESGLLPELARTLREAGEDAGLQFPSPPVVRLLVDDSLDPSVLQVLAQNSQADLSQTRDFPVSGPFPGEEEAAIPPGAFLIVDGSQVVPLTQRVINIGRRLDNQIILDDYRVSRVHAQVRAVRGGYMIFDLDSTGGTLLNGAPVRQALLQPGDVISLSGVPLVYGQDSTNPDATQEVGLDSFEGPEPRI
jgi:hypothetical protein